ncbi:Uncharacterized protein APZ42_005343, partial [Daphnia magna]
KKKVCCCVVVVSRKRIAEGENDRNKHQPTRENNRFLIIHFCFSLLLPADLAASKKTISEREWEKTFGFYSFFFLLYPIFVGKNSSHTGLHYGLETFSWKQKRKKNNNKGANINPIEQGHII